MQEHEGYGRPDAIESRETSPPISDSMTPKGIQAFQGSPEAKVDWVDRGIVDVPVKDLPQPADVNTPADFSHHIQWEDAQAVTRQLPELQKEVKAGKKGDDFSAEDQAAGLDYSQGKRHVYDLYYGSDPVRLEKDGDQYDIVSGRHRVFTAKALELETIPARVIEKVS